MSSPRCPDCGRRLNKLEAFDFGNISLDGFGLVIFEGVEMDLPRSQYVVVEALVRARGCGLTRSTLADNFGEDINDETITKYIERLRANFRKVDADFSQIICLKGFGAYKWQRKNAKSAILPARHPVRILQPEFRLDAIAGLV